MITIKQPDVDEFVDFAWRLHHRETPPCTLRTDVTGSPFLRSQGSSRKNVRRVCVD
jgi:hypothetical protein